MSSTLAWRCPECGGALSGAELLHCSNGHRFPRERAYAGYNLLPSTMAEVVRGDAVYHDSVKHEWIELNQIDTPRNARFHRQIHSLIEAGMRPGGHILELGGGVGFDMEQLLARPLALGTYVFSEISEGMLAYVARRYRRGEVCYCAIDATCLPFADEQFRIVYMIAALHHFPDLDRAVAEMVRVLEPGGILIFGIEPNRTMSAFLERLKRTATALLPKKASHSPADEQAEGFTVADFEAMARRYRLRLVRLEPVWLLCGFVHYGLEFLYLALRLKQRIRLPLAVEEALLACDTFLLSLPGLHQISWHYTAVLEKPSAPSHVRGPANHAE